MPFKESYRNYLKAVTKGKCVADIYTEKRGWQECGKQADHIHHPIAEGFLLEQGEDPEHFAPGVPLCKHHHVGSQVNGNEEYSPDFTFHPDAGEAYAHYKGWKEQKSGMIHTTGFCDLPSPFEEMEKDHHRKAQKGERYWAGTEETDEHLIEKMREKIQKYALEYPDNPPPQRKEHPRTDKSKKKHWYDNLF